MSGVSMCRVVGEGVGSGFGGYQLGVYVPLKALFLILKPFYGVAFLNHFMVSIFVLQAVFIVNVNNRSVVCYIRLTFEISVTLVFKRKAINH